jgi:RNA polymerase sigma-70 factor (ECF subfamily)
MTSFVEGTDVETERWLAERFEGDRSHLRAVAYRILGSRSEADDAVQETWLKLSHSHTDDIANLRGWLTTVVARVCLDMLRSRGSRREEPWEALDDEADPDKGGDPERDALLAEAVGPAMLVVLDALSPPERVAFVLHDLFDVPFPDVATILGRSPAAARQLASRARRRVRGADVPAAGADRQRRLVEAFLAAARGGDLGALLAILDPDVVVTADHAAVLMGARAAVRGATEVVETFAGRARAARPALIDGMPGLVWMQEGRVRVVFGFTVEDDRIVGIELVADADRIDRMELETVGA